LVFNIVVCYRPPNSDHNEFLNDFACFFHDHVLTNYKKNEEVIVMGDFNVNFLDDDIISSNVINCMSSFGLYHLIYSVPTRYGKNGRHSLIDNFFVSCSNSCIDAGTFSTLLSDHLPIFANICMPNAPLHKTNSKSKSNSSVNFQNKYIVDYENILNTSKNFNWNELKTLKCVDTQYNFFIAVIQKVIEKSTVKRSGKHYYRININPWITNEILELIRLKDDLYHQLKKIVDIEIQKQFFALRRKIKAKIRSAKFKYVSHKLKEANGDVRQNWKIINEVKNDFSVSEKPSLPTSLTWKLNVVNSKQDIVNTFNDFFVNVTTNLNLKTDDFLTDNDQYIDSTTSEKNNDVFNKPVNTFPVVSVSHTEVANIIDCLPNKFSTGPDGVQTKIIKLIKNSIIDPLVTIANNMLATGVFPQDLKKAKVIILHKDGVITDPGNYRPISILNIFSKVFERIIHSRLTCFLRDNNIMSYEQFGFRKGSNTDLALITAIDYVKNKLDAGKYCIGVFLDVAKAFDSVSHEILLIKLAKIGITGIMLKLFHNYLSNRQQYVSADGYCSNIIECISGVPQGSILGPILFNIYVNNIVQAVPNAHITMFADDNLMICYSDNIDDLFLTTQINLDGLSNWYSYNGLALNCNKCKYIVFSTAYKKQFIDRYLMQGAIQLHINNIALEKVDNYKYLGLMVTYNLSWECQVKNILKTVNMHLGILSRIRYYLPKKLLKLYYYCNIQSHLQYGIAVWGSDVQTHLIPLEVAIKKAARLITFSGFFEHSQPLLKKLGFQTIKMLWRQFVLSNLYKMKFGMTHISHIDQWSFQNIQDTGLGLRSATGHFMKIYGFKTRYGQNTFTNVAGRFWNNLPIEIRVNSILSLGVFKGEVKRTNWLDTE